MTTLAYLFRQDLDRYPASQIKRLAQQYQFTADNLTDLKWMIAIKHARQKAEMPNTDPTISIVNISGYKLLLTIVEKADDGSLVTYHRALEPKYQGQNPFDYFKGPRNKIVGLSVARYGKWAGVKAKPKIIPDEYLLAYPDSNITLEIDYSAAQQLSKLGWGMLGYAAPGGTIIKQLAWDFEKWYKYPEFNPLFGWITAASDWFTNLVDYLPGARNYSRFIEKVPAYRILGVPQKHSKEDLDHAYVALMLKWDPERFSDNNQKIFAWRMVELIEQAYKSITGISGKFLLRDRQIEKPQLQEVEKEIIYNFLPIEQAKEEEYPELDDEALNAAAAETARKLAALFK